MVLRIISVYKLGIIPRRPAEAVYGQARLAKQGSCKPSIVQNDKYIFNPHQFDFSIKLSIYKENLFIDNKIARAYKYRLTGYNILYRQNRSKCTL